MEFNIGGYDKYVFYERLGINYLERELLRTYRVIPSFSVNDKTPNLDGWLDICDQSAELGPKAIPLHRFSVQIKTLNHEYQNENKRTHQDAQYKYSCDTKVLNTALSNATLDPILLLLVDWRKKKIFWKYLSTEYCFSSLNSREQKSFAVYFSDSDKIDFSTDAWIKDLIQVKTAHKAELSNGTANLFMVSACDPEVKQQIQDASKTINGFMEGQLQFLRQALFPGTWKFGIAFLKSEDGIISAGVYRIVAGASDEFYKVFDEDNEHMIFSCRGPKINIFSVVEEYLLHCVRYFFSDGGLAAQLPYLPDIVLNEIAFDELDNRFLYLQSSAPAGTPKTGDTVYFGLQADELSLDEYDELKKQGRVTSRAEACVHELRQRGYLKLVRPWRKSLTGTLGEEQTEQLSKDIFLNAGQLNLEDTITHRKCIISDIESIKTENTHRLLHGIQKFYNESCRKLGNDFYPEIGKHQLYVFSPTETTGEPEMLRYPNFIFPTKTAEQQAIMDNRDPSKCYHHLALEYIDFSWYRIWRILFRNMISGQFKETNIPNVPIHVDFLASK